MDTTTITNIPTPTLINELTNRYDAIIIIGINHKTTTNTNLIDVITKINNLLTTQSLTTIITQLADNLRKLKTSSKLPT